MSTWRWIVIGLAVLAFVALVFPLVVTQNRLRQTHTQLMHARETKAKLESALSSLKTELDAVNKARSELEANLTEANSQTQELSYSS